MDLETGDNTLPTLLATTPYDRQQMYHEEKYVTIAEDLSSFCPCQHNSQPISTHYTRNEKFPPSMFGESLRENQLYGLI